MAPSSDPVADSIKQFKKQREAHREMFKIYRDLIEAWHKSTAKDPPTLSRLDSLMGDLLTNKKSQKLLFVELFTLCAGAEFSTNHQDKFDEIFKDLEATMEKANELINNLKPPSAPSSSSAKLEHLKIPTFSGNYEDWQSFHDLFQSMVHNRTNLSGAEKLSYLQSALKGGASTVISSFEPTDANYAEAWTHLKTRYSVKREIIFAHIKSFEDFKPRHSDHDAGLRTLADALTKCVRTLKVQGVNVDQWDLILIYLALKKLDPDSRKQWSLDLKVDLPTMKGFIEFLENRARALTSSTQSHKSYSSSGSSSSKPTSSHHVAKSKPKNNQPDCCVKCKEKHPLFKCTEYKNMTPKERCNFVKLKKLCFNCLRDHLLCDCTCPYTCFKCGEKHHTSLHVDSPSAPQPPHQAQRTSSSHCVKSHQPRELVVLLGTLLVNVKDSRGCTQQCRVFVDNGSEAHFISEHCLTRLGFKRQKTNVPLNSIGNRTGPISKGQVSFTIESQTQPFTLDLTALILPKFAGLIPRTSCQSSWKHLEGLKLSDPLFHHAHCTDILLGAAKTGHIMLPQVVSDPNNPNAPVALNTKFGWMINGEAASVFHSSNYSGLAVHHVSLSTQNSELSSALSKFWEQEEPEPLRHPQSSSDVECENHFHSTHTQNEDGTYTVQLPFRDGLRVLGKSRESAVRRFLKVEERLTRQPHVREEYVKSMREYTDLGYLESVPQEDLIKPPSACFYMPHREVVKESSSSTKVRIVFDASAKSSSGLSLNDSLHTGPKLQVDLLPLLIRFMTYPIAMSADIWKFYPQTSIHPSHRDFQRLVWRESPQQPLQDLRMRRVTFGVSAAPYLAIRALHELANRVQASHPRVSAVIKEEFLVDNLLSGAQDLESALELQSQLLQVMKLGGMKLLKWTSNSKELIQAIPPAFRDPSTSLPIDEGEFVKTIGILWNPHSDTFSVKITVPDAPMVTTKRTVLSIIARTFDPLGWLSPVTVTPKVLIQNLWKANLGWDEPLPLHFHQQWRKYCEDLTTLHSFSLNRNAFSPPHPTSTHLTHQLHGFSDGSDVAYAACVYVRTRDSHGRVSVNLLTAKTRVNPIRKPTTPRSELCGAVLLTNLITTVQKSVNVEFTSIFCWSDSTVVLGRISTEKKLPVYELNRIRTILASLPPQHWNHVKGDENPADAPSRGIPPYQLLNHPMWIHGPRFLLEDIPDLQPISASVATIQPTPISDLIASCSLFMQLKRRVGFILRFCHNLRREKQDRRIGQLSVFELDSALISILKIVQAESFQPEIENCRCGLVLKSKLKFLSPFIDGDGVLRVGGRLNQASISYAQKHPALLPKYHHFAKVLATYYHVNHLHAGPTLLLSIIREQFWPIRGLDLVKSVVKRCVTCHREQASTSNQLMGQLPPSRVNPAPPFSQAGVDYAGPFHLALRTGRKPPLIKSYVSVFVCMATKATHLELVSDLSTQAFIAALKRFISRRGLPADIYSDEGTNFVGAKSDLDELQALIKSQSHRNAVCDFLNPKGITFHNNPPASPHHGGLWEAMVKSMKFHLRRIMGTRHLTVEEFTTLVCQVEAMLNSRPLTPMSDDPNDHSALTPGHFLIGRPLVALPHPDITHLAVGTLSRWQMVEALNQNIWNAWKREYLCLLQSRPKWYTPLPDIVPGTMVLLLDKDSSLGPQKWKLGRIVETFPGADGKTRVCDVRTNVTDKNPKGTIIRRPIVKLSPLPIH